MYSSVRFRKGDPVEGFSFTGQKIIGHFVRALPSFGVLILGIPEGSTELPSEHKCAKLSLTRLSVKPRTRLKGATPSFANGDLCIGMTPQGDYIIGKYSNAGPKPYAFMRGVKAVNGLVSPFEPIQSFKVLRSSLKQQA